MESKNLCGDYNQQHMDITDISVRSGREAGKPWKATTVHKTHCFNMIRAYLLPLIKSDQIQQSAMYPLNIERKLVFYCSFSGWCVFNRPEII